MSSADASEGSNRSFYESLKYQWPQFAKLHHDDSEILTEQIQLLLRYQEELQGHTFPARHPPSTLQRSCFGSPICYSGRRRLSRFGTSQTIREIRRLTRAILHPKSRCKMVRDESRLRIQNAVQNLH